MCAGGVKFVFDSEAGFGRTRADGEHVPAEHERRQRPALGQREKGSRDSLFFFLSFVCV